MTHTFNSEVSLHYWLLWPTVCHGTPRDDRPAYIKLYNFYRAKKSVGMWNLNGMFTTRIVWWSQCWRMVGDQLMRRMKSANSLQKRQNIASKIWAYPDKFQSAQPLQVFIYRTFIQRLWSMPCQKAKFSTENSFWTCLNQSNLDRSKILLDLQGVS